MLLKAKKQNSIFCLEAVKIVVESKDLYAKSFENNSNKVDYVLDEKKVKKRVRAIARAEMALLVTLCQPDTDVGLLVTQCLSLLCTLPTLAVEEPLNSIKANADVYHELCAVIFRNESQHTDSESQWRDIMTVLRRVEAPTAGNREAWATIVTRWYIS
jgi:hypothetical protein